MSQKRRQWMSVSLVVCLLCSALGWSGLRGAEIQAAPAAAPPVAGGPVALVGQVGGISHAVATLGHFAYVGMGSQVVVLDAEDPSNPVFVGSIVLPGIVKDIYAHNALAIYIAAGEAGLYQLSVTATTSLVVAGHYATTDAREVFRHGDQIYLADGEGGLLILEDEVGGFHVVGSFGTDGAATAVAVQNQYVFVTDRGADAPDGGVHILHVQDPAHPVEVGNLETTSRLHDIALWGHYAYVTMTEEGVPDQLSVQVIDFLEPTNPRWVGSGATLGYGLHARVESAANRLYVVEDEGKITVFEAQGATLTARGSLATAGTSTDVTVRFDGLAFIADGPRGLALASVANPESIVKLGTYETGGHVVDVAVHAGHLYLADRGEPLDTLAYVRGGLKVVDATQPTAPRVVGYGGIPANGLPTVSGSVMGLTIADNHLYMAGGACEARGGSCSYRVHGLDITDPATPTFVAEFSSPSDTRRPNRIAAADGYLYVAAPTIAQTGLGILPLPGLGERAHYGLPAATDVALAPPYAYVVSADGAGLRILDISSPMTATEVATFMPTGSFEGVTVAGGHVFLAGGEAGVTVVDVTNPMSPTQVSHYDTPGSAQDVVVYGSLAFVADGSAGLQVLDISDPAAPSFAGGYDTPGNAVTAQVDERFVYLADGEAGLSILQVGLLGRGRVADILGAPVAGVTIRAGSMPPVTTNDEGIFAVGHLLADTFIVTAEQPGYGFVPTTYTVTAGAEMPALHFTRVAAPVAVTLEPGVASELTYTDTQSLPTTLAFPADAVTVTTALWLTPTLAANYGTVDFANHAFELGPDLTFAAPVTVTLRYSDADVAQVTDEGALWLGWWNGTGWQDAATTCASPTPPMVDTATNTLTLEICRTGRFALFGPTSQHWLPLLGVGASGG